MGRHCLHSSLHSLAPHPAQKEIYDMSLYSVDAVQMVISQSLTSWTDLNWHYCSEKYFILLPMPELFNPLSELHFKHANPVIDEIFMFENPIDAGGRCSSVGSLCNDWRKVYTA